MSSPVFHRICAAAERAARIPPGDITKRTKIPAYAEARTFAAYIARKHMKPRPSYLRLARLLGLAAHSEIYRALKRLEARLESDAALRCDLAEAEFNATGEVL